MFFNYISVVNPSRRFFESGEGLVKNAPKLKIATKNQRSITTILKPEAVHIKT
jgi:hypothetical protein